MKKLKDELLSTELAIWRKKALFICVVLLSVFPFVIIYKSSMADFQAILWQIRHFVGIAVIQGIAQISLAWYVLKNKVPNYVVYSVIIIALLFQTTFGISVILVAIA